MHFCAIFLALTASVARAAPVRLDKRIQPSLALTHVRSSNNETDSASSAVEFSLVVPATSTSATSAPTPSTSDFHLQNGIDAQKLNAQFKSLTATSSCTEGEEACVGTSFAQCVSGSFVLSACTSGTVCAALPLVNKPGTSIACDTTSDVAARIAATGATGGIDGSASSDSTSDSGTATETGDVESEPSAEATTASTAASPTASDFHAQNGLDAQALNAQFKTLTSNSTCTDGEEACVGTSFAQCVSGSFVLTPCSAGLVCAALPLVNKPGTSVACDTLDDVQARISATGVTGGISG
ncbi:hypothetical protein MSAN_00698000 [Mycena sanguinolenta]|uniref:Carbohydrate-binding module family 19 domain-containing protein n=1 Tax=Mycena sanguinolenta TaxID=230812 RepID=A0A8H6Z0Z7_9AGAR|nr:hypothetical protein MSAN_00698000 [Mycena sanguinolenta]